MSCRCAHLKRLKQAGTRYEEKSAVYMDYNAAAPPDRRVLALYQNTALKSWAHPSSPHLAGLEAQELLRRAAEDCLELTGREFSRIEFGAGATSVLRRFMEGAGRTVSTSGCDHSAVLDQAEAALLLDVDRQGKIDTAGLAQALESHPDGLIVYSPVNHETGAVQDCRKIWEQAKGTGALVFIDGAQSAVRLPIKEWLPY
jgi:cysteine desulfurase